MNTASYSARWQENQASYKNLLTRLAQAKINTFHPDDIAAFGMLVDDCCAYIPDCNNQHQIRQLRQQARGIITTCLASIINNGAENAPPDEIVIEILHLLTKIFLPGREVTIIAEPKDTPPA